MYELLTDQYGTSAELWTDSVGDLTVLHVRTKDGEDQECLNLQPWEAVHLAQELLLFANGYLGGNANPFDLTPEDTVARVADHLKEAMRRKDQALQSERENLAEKIAEKDGHTWGNATGNVREKYLHMADVFKELQNEGV